MFYAEEQQIQGSELEHGVFEQQDEDEGRIIEESNEIIGPCKPSQGLRKDILSTTLGGQHFDISCSPT